jgi:hypothetical protein
VFQHKVNGRGGQIPIQAAISELPEWLQSALYRGAAKVGLTETDPLWGCLVANGELLKSYLDAQADGTKKSVEELTQAIRELSRSVKHRVEPESRPENIAKLWAVILIAVVAVFGVGYFACWSRTHLALEARMQEASQRVERVINAQPAANRVPSFLAAHSGNISIGPIISSDGKSETQGIIIRPGDLKFGQPTFSSEGGNALVPIQ